jgi:hypothetical protein
MIKIELLSSELYNIHNYTVYLISEVIKDILLVHEDVVALIIKVRYQGLYPNSSGSIGSKRL